MSVEEQIVKALDRVMVPGAQRSLNQLNLVRGISVNRDEVRISLASTALDSEDQQKVKSDISEVVGAIPEVTTVEVDFVEKAPQDINQVKRVVAVMSGKGGVGKSLVTGLLAIALRRQGKEVGILDADITGPSIPKMFGLDAHPGGAGSAILPVLSKTGIPVMSINLLLPHEDDAVIWRGPLIGKAIQQFWQDVLWGDLDYLVVDLPPGTADVPLTVMQTLPLAGVIIVFTPQDLTTMVVRKAVQMAQKMNIPVLGVVENMSYFLLPDGKKKVEIFGKSKGEEMAASAKAPLLMQLPIDPQLAQLCDEGNIEGYESEILSEFSSRVLMAIN
jgi:hydrogenase maturation protease